MNEHIGRHGRLTLLTALIISQLLLFNLVSPALGHSPPNFGSNWPDACDTLMSSQCMAQTNSHFILPVALEPHQHSAIVNHTPTVFRFSENQVTIYIVSSGFRDVFVQDYLGPLNGKYAWTWCWADESTQYGGSAANHTRYCYPQEIRFNLSYKANYSTQARTNAIACHEMGHTLGLRHNNASSGCMKDPPTDTAPVDYNYTDITSHENQHLEAGY